LLVDPLGEEINNSPVTSRTRGPRRLPFILTLAIAAASAGACGGGSSGGDGGPGAAGSSGAAGNTGAAGSTGAAGGSMCGGGSGAGAHPDTGYGANTPVPATTTCTDYCTRAADCAAHLCNEDTMSTTYTALEPLLLLACESGVCNATVLAQLTPANWQCFFQSSCRQVYGENTCHVANACYSCN